MEVLSSAAEIILDSTPAELIAAVMLAAASALAGSGVYRLLRRRSADPSMLMVAIMIPVICVPMALVAGHVAVKVQPPRAREYPSPPKRIASTLPRAARTSSIAE